MRGIILIEYLKNLEKILKCIGLNSMDCHQDLPRGTEYRQLGLGAGAICIEEAMCLAGLIYATRPDIVLELGTENGASCLILGAAVKDLGVGKVFSVDMANKNPPFAESIVVDENLPVEFVLNTNSLDFLKGNAFDQSKKYFVFSDTNINTRPEEVELIRRFLPPGTVIAVHDTSDLHPHGPMNLKNKLHPDIQFVEIDTPRGLTILKTKVN